MVLVAATLAISACTASKVDADAAIRVGGTVDAPGGAAVGLLRLADAGELVFGSVLAVGTLGAICFVDDPPGICGDVRKAEVGSDGRFTFDLEGRDTTGLVGQASDFELMAVTSGPDGGRRQTTVRFKIQAEQLEVPSIGFWDAALTVDAQGAAVRAGWPALPPVLGADPTYAVRFIDDGVGPGAVVWNVPEASSGVEVDARLLEDRAGRVDLTASSSVEGPDTTFRITHFASPASFSAGDAPPSRGLACSVGDAEGAATAALDPCPLTDGDLFTAAGSSGDGTVRTTAAVDLGSTGPVSLVVARGAVGSVTVETSVDGVTWDLAGTSAGSLVAVTPPAPVDARYVRVRTTYGTDLSNLAEISVWR